HADALLAKMHHAAGNAKLDACDAQALAQRFLGDTMGANIIMLGFAWQLGLVPVSLQALQRAIELNNVAVPMNQLALAIGRLAAGDPAALTETTARSVHAPVHAPVADDMTFDALVAHRVDLLTQYQNAAYAAQFASFVKQVADAETRVSGAPGRLSRAVAQQLSRLMAYKDEYEVARLYAHTAFADSLGETFEGKPGRDFRLEFHMAPPLIARGKDGGVPKKVTIGPWLWPVLRGMAKLRGLRGGVFDVFGYTLERRMERQLIADYRTTMERALAGLSADTLTDVIALAEAPAKIRGYGHVKLANLAMAKRVEATIAARLDVTPATGDAVAQALAHARSSGKSLKGIPVVTTR
ncbi:pyruvate ferredoxin oxidoreductase, partial [Pandoraea apista]